MKILGFILISTLVFSSEPKSPMDKFVYNHLLLTKSKMGFSPIVWQDFKEGYLRNYTVRYADILLDSLDQRKLTSYHAGIRHFQRLEDLRVEIKKGEPYKHIITRKSKPNYNINYFSSSIK